MDRRYIVIENRLSERKYLLPFKKFTEKGIPEGFTKRGSTVPFTEGYWNIVKNLPIYTEQSC